MSSEHQRRRAGLFLFETSCFVPTPNSPGVQALASSWDGHSWLCFYAFSLLRCYAFTTVDLLRQIYTASPKPYPPRHPLTHSLLLQSWTFGPCLISSLLLFPPSSPRDLSAGCLSIVFLLGAVSSVSCTFAPSLLGIFAVDCHPVRKSQYRIDFRNINTPIWEFGLDTSRTQITA